MIYRITSIPSTNPPPILEDDKDALNEFCLDSFLKAFRDIKPEITFLADHCSPETIRMIKKSVRWDHKIIKSKMGINQAMLTSYEIASSLQGPVLFQECDYLYDYSNGPIGAVFEEAVNRLGWVSPYDHLNFYKDKSIHSSSCEIELIANRHFRTTERNTMTWATSAHNIRFHRSILDRYGYLDSDVWRELRDQGEKLWVPIPSFSTHMVKDYMAPGVDWGAFMGKGLKSL